MPRSGARVPLLRLSEIDRETETETDRERYRGRQRQIQRKERRKMPQEKQPMKSVKRESISEDFQYHCCDPIPDVPVGGARVKIYYAGACYTDHQVVKSGQRRPRMAGVQDTSLFPGYEVSGVIDELCSTVPSDTDLSVGDRVVVYPTCEQEEAGDGYAEYIAIKDLTQLVKIPDSLTLDVAAMLPCGGLMAYSAVERAKPFVTEKLQQSTNDIVNVLIVGAGGLSLWTLKLAEHYIGDNSPRVRIIMADTSIEKLHLAKEEGCFDVIEWKEDLHEEYIAMRIKNVCKGGVDVVIDFVSSSRTIGRAINVLNENGVLIVGGNSMCDVPINLHSLAKKAQSVLGVHRGTRQQLKELVHLVADGQIKPPRFRTFPIDDANRVFLKLSQSKLIGRAVFRVFGEGEDSVFFHDNPISNSSSFDLENGYCSSPECTVKRMSLFSSHISTMSPGGGTPVDQPVFTL